ncbi:hypothetical protein HYQ46_005917 [Verticillium longisporum]|nr:hypothetical protein HYQ46_005917 [Verticillium longisporum]
MEGHHRYGGNHDHGEGREENAAVLERFRQEHDAGADEGLQQREEGLHGAGISGSDVTRRLAAWQQRPPLPGVFCILLFIILNGLVVRIGQVLAGKRAVGSRDAAVLLKDKLASEALGLQHLVGGENRFVIVVEGSVL